ncbi:MAG: TlpA family protein disulfide reductase [Gemmataceae bacterium]
MYGHERSLVKRLANQPFALLGINSDRDREKLKKVLKDKKLTWRSWWNGGSTRGPISTAWKVTGWPTIYVLDEEGVIRYRNVRGPAMDKAVDELLAELKTKKKEK